MKKLKNDFRVLVEFREIGDGVVCAHLSPLIKFEPCDFRVFSEMVLSRLLPAAVSVHPLYDGTFVLTSYDEDILLDINCCADHVSCDLAPFDVNMELPNGSFGSVNFSLNQSDSHRRDYSFRGSRYLDLRGYFSIDVPENEEGEN